MNLLDGPANKGAHNTTVHTSCRAATRDQIGPTRVATEKREEEGSSKAPGSLVSPYKCDV